MTCLKIKAGVDVKKPQVSRLNVSVSKTLLATNNPFLADHTDWGQSSFPNRMCNCLDA